MKHAVFLIALAIIAAPALAQSNERNIIKLCAQHAEYAENLQRLRQQYPTFNKRVAKEVARGETPIPAQRKAVDATVDRVFAFPPSANPIMVSNEIGRRCIQAANAALK